MRLRWSRTLGHLLLKAHGFNAALSLPEVFVGLKVKVLYHGLLDPLVQLGESIDCAVQVINLSGLLNVPGWRRLKRVWVYLVHFLEVINKLL